MKETAKGLVAAISAAICLAATAETATVFWYADGGYTPLDPVVTYVEDGDVISHAVPAKPSSEQYHYSFAGWAQRAGGVWGDYLGVWHLGEHGDGEVAILDSTENAFDGTAADVSTSESEGMVGRACRIARDNNHARGIIIDATNGVKNALVNALGGNFSASFWICPEGESNNVGGRRLAGQLSGGLQGPRDARLRARCRRRRLGLREAAASEVHQVMVK